MLYQLDTVRQMDGQTQAEEVIPIYMPPPFSEEASIFRLPLSMTEERAKQNCKS